MTFRLLSRLAQTALLLAAPALLVANEVRTVALDAPGADGARLQLQLATAPEQKVYSLAGPYRIVIDLKATKLARGLRLPQAAGPVTSVRSSQRPDGKTLRLVLELNRQLNPKVAVNGTQLTVELGKLPVASTAPVTPAASVPVRAAHAPADAGRDIVIAVDAGHGGQDPGATGATGTREKDVTLEIARALVGRINATPGFRAVLTRDSDRFIELPGRIDLARRAHADMFVSVHADAIKDRSVSGSSVYVLSARGASSDTARRLAEEENAKGGVVAGEAGDSLNSVLVDLSQTASIATSMDAARRVLGQLDHVGAIRKSEVQQANFVVLKTPNIPSLLVETAYISNPGEEKKLRSPEHQAQIAAAIFDGVREYFQDRPPDGTLYAQQRNKRNAAPTIVADRTGP